MRDETVSAVEIKEINLRICENLVARNVFCEIIYTMIKIQGHVLLEISEAGKVACKVYVIILHVLMLFVIESQTWDCNHLMSLTIQAAPRPIEIGPQ